MKIRTFYYRIPELADEKWKGRVRPEIIKDISSRYKRKLGFDDLNFYTANKVRPHVTGGITTVYLLNEDGTTVSVGEAICSTKDNFNYKLGREIALGRARAQLESNHG